ncbi:type II toxin-antitoxin system RelE/ParE family toxin [Calycomorphotria hydatis]|uniref:Plasmid stabilization system protein n=1 Tax=Calycomorphotria hydatis TaxID=2528027 RepID=A0A517T520_9PLAN|nr:type II toxin-antitoxin system RelE/ParE family toxin [Calycomorphotria hydatis]QDT63460.1 Plasmid stabilization system protein [Calycomorphotria hydatis]
MTWLIRELPRAKADKRKIFEWLLSHSRKGAVAWLDAYDRKAESLSDQPASHPLADENAELTMEVRQTLFRTRRGKPYRIIFTIVDEEVLILRVRGPGQDWMNTDDVSTS